jgi:hypothetical protein
MRLLCFFPLTPRTAFYFVNGQVKLSMEEDYDIGHSIRTSLIPEAVLWYTGEAIEEDDEGDYEEVRSAFIRSAAQAPGS